MPSQSFRQAILSLLSLSILLLSPQAKADVNDGEIERFVCLTDKIDKGDLQTEFVQLNATDASKGYGFGGGNMALKLSNNGFAAPTVALAQANAAGGQAVFGPSKKNNRLQIFFKPVNIDTSHVRINACFLDKARGILGFSAPLSKLDVRPLTNGWYAIDDDYDDIFHINGVLVLRVTYKLEASGDNGHILIGTTQLLNDHLDRTTVSPSNLIMEKMPCSAVPICGISSQHRSTRGLVGNGN